jgi:hypothetical protein
MGRWVTGLTLNGPEAKACVTRAAMLRVSLWFTLEESAQRSAALKARPAPSFPESATPAMSLE